MEKVSRALVPARRDTQISYPRVAFMLKPGDTFERYTIDAVLGQGGMGTVYRAHDNRLDRRVAIKVISEGAAPDSDARLLREARAAAALDHPHAVSIFDVGELDGSPYIVMELVSGRTLRDVMSSSVPVATRVGWLVDVARALTAAHRKGLVHRDVKPENIMVRDDGVVKVLDFGVARRAQGDVDPSGPTQATALPTLTKAGVNIGTPLYMAPEQIRGAPLDGRVDQFAWGVVAFEILSGKLPWRAPNDALAAVASILTDEPDGAVLDAASVPAEVRSVVLRALSKKPDDRFASMNELVLALDSAKGEGSRSAPPPPGARVPAPGATSLMRYSTAEVREILARAVEQQEHKRADARLGFDDLLAAAREVGVDDQTLREASRELRERVEVELPVEVADYATWRRRKRRKFHRHFGVYLIVNTAFFVMGILTGGFIEAMQPALWWGIFVAIHALKAYTADEDDWREERAKLERRLRKVKRRKEAVSKAIEEGAAALLSTGVAIRRRFEVPACDQVRVVDQAAEAEREAAVAEEMSAKRRR